MRVPASRLAHRSARRSLAAARGPGSTQGRTNAAAESTAQRLASAANAISTYPTPGSRIFPPTTWCDKTASVPVAKIERASDASASSGGVSRCAPLAVDRALYWNRYNETPLAVDDRAPVADAKSACAMVPLNPNELSRAAAVASPHRGSTSPGMRNDPDDAIDARCAFSLRAIHLVSRASLLRTRESTGAAAR